MMLSVTKLMSYAKRFALDWQTAWLGQIGIHFGRSRITEFCSIRSASFVTNLPPFCCACGAGAALVCVCVCMCVCVCV